MGSESTFKFPSSSNTQSNSSGLSSMSNLSRSLSSGQTQPYSSDFNSSTQQSTVKTDPNMPSMGSESFSNISSPGINYSLFPKAPNNTPILPPSINNIRYDPPPQPVINIDPSLRQSIINSGEIPIGDIGTGIGEDGGIESTNNCDFKLNRLNNQLNQIINNFNNYRDNVIE